MTVGLPFTALHAHADTNINFTLDWRFEGPAAPFLMALDRGYFKEEGLNVTIDSGSGSAGAVTRVATGAYDMGFADFNALVEYTAANPSSAIQGVYMVYNNTPAAVFTLKDSGILTPADLVGKTLAAPVFDGGRKAWPSFAGHNGLAVDSVEWQSVDPAIRETLLARKQVDGITGFYFTGLLNLEARGVAMDNIVVMRYSDFDVALYGNAIIAGEKIMKENPEAVAAFNRAFNRALVETIADPATAVTYVKKRDGLINEPLELRRLVLALEAHVVTEETLAEGLGAVTSARMEQAIDEAVESFGLTYRPSASQLFNTELLPARDQRSVPQI
ncbi:ABC transporter substrate-binding protein [Salinispirillum sp. LH 10-3-1]|uniref:Thiamine pyrimidine synthase n=1 Tax=Salinispirillum sp. LH 10-3-1 TaxID=2952525 RepID=A0AB38YBG2_9GAMM